MKLLIIVAVAFFKQLNMAQMTKDEYQKEIFFPIGEPNTAFSTTITGE